jgi:membrane associated rhomboid family serine protease
MQLVSAGTIAVTASTGAPASGGVAFAAHVAGFLAGVVGIFIFRRRDRDYWDGMEGYT